MCADTTAWETAGNWTQIRRTYIYPAVAVGSTIGYSLRRLIFVAALIVFPLTYTNALTKLDGGLVVQFLPSLGRARWW